MLKRGRNSNKNDEAVVSDGVEILTNSAVVGSQENSDRIYLAITITTRDAFVRLMPAATEPTTRKGVFLKKDQLYELPTDTIYTGEVSIINKKDNEKPKYYITEF